MNHLLRSHAPISERGWEEIDGELSRSLKHYLAGRKLVDFTGPKGWDHACVVTGEVEAVDSPYEGVQAHRRLSRPLIELRTVFDIPRAELEAIDRGKPDPDTDVLVDVARRAALAEDGAIFHGLGAGDIDGIAATDAAPLGPRRAPRQDIERQIHSAGAVPAQRDGRYRPRA